MDKSAYKLVLRYLRENKLAVSPDELSRETGKSKVTVHNTLNRLIVQGWVVKQGISPHTYYSAIDPLDIENHPEAKKNAKRGTVDHFISWCKAHGYHIPESALEYKTYIEKH